MLSKFASSSIGNELRSTMLTYLHIFFQSCEVFLQNLINLLTDGQVMWNIGVFELLSKH